MAVLLDTENRYRITKNSHRKSDMRVNELDFGDGYGQSTINGINAEIEVWSLTFMPLEKAETINLSSLLTNSKAGGQSALEWVPAGEATAKYWKLTGELTETPVSGVLWQISCQINRIYPIV